tara:strand:+ start:500 stop:688 length:189 start_codon:yes stop_codon:yes gene_type:complete
VTVPCIENSQHSPSKIEEEGRRGRGGGEKGGGRRNGERKKKSEMSIRLEDKEEDRIGDIKVE